MTRWDPWQSHFSRLVGTITKASTRVETNRAVPVRDNVALRVSCGDSNANNTLAEASIVFHQAYH